MSELSWHSSPPKKDEVRKLYPFYGTILAAILIMAWFVCLGCAVGGVDPEPAPDHPIVGVWLSRFDGGTDEVRFDRDGNFKRVVESPYEKVTFVGTYVARERFLAITVKYYDLGPSRVTPGRPETVMVSYFIGDNRNALVIDDSAVYRRQK